MITKWPSVMLELLVSLILISLVWCINIIKTLMLFSIVWFQKISIPPPPRRVFSSLSHHPPDFPFRRASRYSPPPPGISRIFPLGPPYPQEIPNPQIKRFHFFILIYLEPKRNLVAADNSYTSDDDVKRHIFHVSDLATPPLLFHRTLFKEIFTR